ncbi:hypothetical protein ACVW00_004008 [Marmoricola sp. URHA0025 HA25]
MHRARVKVVVALAAAAALVSGCAGTGPTAAPSPRSGEGAFADLSGRQVAEATAAALKKVSSVHLEGTGRYRGDDATMDVAVNRAGTCVGGFEVGGARFDVIHAPDGRWLFRANARYWQQFGPRRHHAQLVERFGDHWVDVSDEDLSDELKANCDLSALRAEIIPDDVDGCVKGLGGPATEEPTVQVMCDDTRVWVQAVAPHRPVKYDGPHGDDIEDITFSDYDRPVKVDLPPDDQIIGVGDSALV